MDEQRGVISLKLSMLFHNTTKAVLQGHYGAEYFGGKENFEDAAKRLKAWRLPAHGLIYERRVRGSAAAGRGF